MEEAMMNDLNRLLTDSYVKFSDEAVVLSGKIDCDYLPAVKILAEIKTFPNGLNVVCSSISAEALKKVKQYFGDVYAENTEAYIIEMDDCVNIYANSNRAILYAANSLYGHSLKGLKKGLVYSCPCVEHRSARCYLPARDDMGYFKSFIDTLVYFGYNSLILEIGGAMEFKQHPEINEYWIKYSETMREFNGKPYVAQNIGKRVRNSIHTYNAKGGVLSQEEVAELVDYCRERCIEIIPEVPSLSHSEYILGCYPELAECKDDVFPDTCCPQNEKLYELIFELYDEVIEVFQPETLHIGHDEWWVMCLCDKCKDKLADELYAYNINRCYDYLQQKNIKVAMWADKLTPNYEKSGEAQCGAFKPTWSVPTNSCVDIFGSKIPLFKRIWFLKDGDSIPTNAIQHNVHQTYGSYDLINTNIRLWDWTYGLSPELTNEFINDGRYVVYGNYNAIGTLHFKERVERGLKGISVSNWLASDEVNMQRWGTIANLGYGAFQAWNAEFDERDIYANFLYVAHEMYLFRNRKILSGNHIVITHAVKNILCDNDSSEFDYKSTYLGKYVITYTDYSFEEYEIYFDHNIGARNVSKMVEPSINSEYMVSFDKHLKRIVSLCDIENEKNGVYYKMVLPLNDKKVLNVHYEPYTDDYKSDGSNIEIKNIEIVSDF